MIYSPFSAGSYQNNKILLGDDFGFHAIIAELSHYIDDTHYGHNAFGELFARSDSAQDYDFIIAADGSGHPKDSAAEDFDSTFSNYWLDTSYLFSKAIESAEQGHNLLLEKTLFIANIFTIETLEYTTIYEMNGDNKIIHASIPVTKDAKNTIIGLNNIPVYDGEGNYNLEGLKTIFIQ